MSSTTMSRIGSCISSRIKTTKRWRRNTTTNRSGRRIIAVNNNTNNNNNNNAMMVFGSTTTVVVLLFVVLLQSKISNAYYLPGVRPQSFEEGDEVKLKVNKLTSSKTQIPLDYYYLPFCKPSTGIVRDNENLGEFLAGDKIENSPYKLYMKHDMYCQHLCIADLGIAIDNSNNKKKKKKKKTTGKDEPPTVKAIMKGYHNNWIVDNLPAASKVEDSDRITTRFWQGFPIGYVAPAAAAAASNTDSSSMDGTPGVPEPADMDLVDYTNDDGGGGGEVYINNHVNIEISYHEVEDEPGHYRVVRFTVEPFSIAHNMTMEGNNIVIPTEDVDNGGGDDNSDENKYNLPKLAIITNPISSCDPTSFVNKHTDFNMIQNNNIPQQIAYGKVLFTYDVIWIPDLELQWASRWDIYLSMNNAVPAKVHWLSIANSLVIVFVLTAMIAAILVRNLHRDIARYNRVSTSDDVESRAEELEEYGWKLVHADVFRPPSFSPMLLCIASGTGAQLLCMSLSIILFSALGFMSPARRGHLLMAELVSFAFMGIVNGYVSAVLYKTLKGTKYQQTTTIAAIGFPGIAFSIFLLMNVVALINHSTDAVPFVTMFILVVLWFGVSIPLVFAGAYLGYKSEPIEFPVHTSSIERQIPKQPWFMNIPYTMLIGGLLPFGSCFVELYYVMSSLWMDYYYYVFGFLLLVFFILLLTSAEITILFTYFQLCNEDYLWWWRSFSNAGSTAIYVFMYSFIYFQQLEANTTATYVLYFGYMALVSLGIYTMMGFIGLLSSLYFNKIIFSSVKID